MSVYDVMRGCINGAWSDDECDYDTYDELHTFIADAEYEYEKLEADNEKLKAENAKLRELVSHLMYVKPADVTAIAHDGKLLRFDEMLAEVGMRFEVDA